LRKKPVYLRHKPVWVTKRKRGNRHPKNSIDSSAFGRFILPRTSMRQRTGLVLEWGV
jgi:hypothetical protein